MSCRGGKENNYFASPLCQFGSLLREMPARQMGCMLMVVVVLVKVVVVMKGEPGVQVRLRTMHQVTPSCSTRAVLYCARFPTLS